MGSISVTPDHSYVASVVSECQHRGSNEHGTFRAACLELHSGQKILGKPHLSVVCCIKKVILQYYSVSKKDQLEMLLPVSNNMNIVLCMHIYVLGKWRLEDLRDFSVRKDMLAAGAALRLPPHNLHLRWSSKAAYKTLPHHSSGSSKVNMFGINPSILS